MQNSGVVLINELLVTIADAFEDSKVCKKWSHSQCQGAMRKTDSDQIVQIQTA